MKFRKTLLIVGVSTGFFLGCESKTKEEKFLQNIKEDAEQVSEDTKDEIEKSKEDLKESKKKKRKKKLKELFN